MPPLKPCVVDGCERLTFEELCSLHREGDTVPASARILPAPTPPPPPSYGISTTAAARARRVSRV